VSKAYYERAEFGLENEIGSANPFSAGFRSSIFSLFADFNTKFMECLHIALLDGRRRRLQSPDVNGVIEGGVFGGPGPSQPGNSKEQNVSRRNC
jgi:hypothetical protein